MSSLSPPPSQSESQSLSTPASSPPSTSFDASFDVIIVGLGIAGCAAALSLAKKSQRCAVIVPSEDKKESNSYWAQGGIIYKSPDLDEAQSLVEDILTAGAHKNDIHAAEKLARNGPEVVKTMLINPKSPAFVEFDRHSPSPSTSTCDTESEENSSDDDERDERDEQEDSKSVHGDEINEIEETLSLTLEGSHSKSRIIHWRDHTGKAIMQSMTKAVFESETIEKLCGFTVIDLITVHDSSAVRCVGVRAVRSDGSGSVSNFRAKSVILATGGCGEVYAHTSNPMCARGDGVAMALRAGAEVKNMEFIQFHPTTLFIPGERSFLLTEALRGEGAKLINPVTKQRFAYKYHPKGELAPRDVVSRMIVEEMRICNCDHVLLDMTHADDEYIQRRFPSIYAHASSRGFDMRSMPLPVVPAAHYACGGIKVDLDGRSSLEGLFAVGEVSCTGLHGANRLASTSLLEGLVWGAAAAAAAAPTQPRELSANGDSLVPQALKPADSTNSSGKVCTSTNKAPTDPATKEWVQETWTMLKKIMWNHVGIIRHRSALQTAVSSLTALAREVNARHALMVQTKEGAEEAGPDGTLDALLMSLIGLRNAITVGLCIAKSALNNPVSAGAHYVIDDKPVELEQEQKVQDIQGAYNSGIFTHDLSSSHFPVHQTMLPITTSTTTTTIPQQQHGGALIGST